ncbi:hypothetical protein F4775DRAFT_588579 [Biscogniauxia sp. FL1348]|nr:hypothetical protein F4775DRAFT_588579 [Biscogniauxia sp. FL1348]
MIDVIAITIRVVLLLVAVFVIGLSMALAGHQRIGSVPTETNISVFLGFLALAVSGLGLLALWVERIRLIIVMGMDVIITVLYIASSIAFIHALRGVPSCGETDKLSTSLRVINPILNGGCMETSRGMSCANAFGPHGEDLTVGRCVVARMDFFFQLQGFIWGSFMTLIDHVLLRRGGVHGFFTNT